MTDFRSIVAEMEALHEQRARDLGITVEELDERNRRADEDRKRADARQRWIEVFHHDVSAKVLAEAFDGGLREEPPLLAARRWWRSTVPMLILCGTPGTGKTLAAVSLVCDHGGEIVRAIDLARRIDPWESEIKRGVRELSIGARLCVLDDLGTEVDTARTKEALFRFVDARLTQETRTIITANMAKADIRQAYGDRIADRLNGVAVALEFNGPSLRGKGAGL